jgi:hypothetical protein
MANEDKIRATRQTRTMDGTADDSIIPRPNKEIDDVLGTPQAIIDARPGASGQNGSGLREFPEIIGEGITSCMRERTAHLRVEKEIDDWVRHLSTNKFERNKQLQLAREQFDTARLAVEALYGRFRTLATTAKN